MKDDCTARLALRDLEVYLTNSVRRIDGVRQLLPPGDERSELGRIASRAEALADEISELLDAPGGQS